jgi:rfaE bifunctional protein nucleotidyltransferase chain/domain
MILNPIDRKIVEISQLNLICRRLHDKKRKIVHCHGCFDFLHLGHLRHFKAARQQGDILIVTVTLDQFVNKGPGHPFYSAMDRAEMLAALDIVDYVCLNPWPTAAETIETLKTDIYVKGREYSDGTALQDSRFRREVEAVEKTGGRIYFTDEITFSSSNILERQALVV